MAAIVIAVMGCGKAKDQPQDAPAPIDTPWRVTLAHDKHPRSEHSVVSVAKYGEDKRWIELQIGPPGVVGCGQQPKLATKTDFVVTAIFRNQPPLKPGVIRDGTFVKVSILQDTWRTTQLANLEAELVEVSDPLAGKLRVRAGDFEVTGDFTARACPQEPAAWASWKPTTKLTRERLIEAAKSSTEKATSDAEAIRAVEQKLGPYDAAGFWFGIEAAGGPEGPTCWRLMARMAPRGMRSVLELAVEQAPADKCWSNAGR